MPESGNTKGKTIKDTLTDIITQLLALFELEKNEKIENEKINELYQQIVHMVQENHFFIEKYIEKYDKKLKYGGEDEGEDEGECAICYEPENHIDEDGTNLGPLHKCPNSKCNKNIHRMCWIRTRYGFIRNRSGRINRFGVFRCPFCTIPLIMGDSDEAPSLAPPHLTPSLYNGILTPIQNSSRQNREINDNVNNAVAFCLLVINIYMLRGETNPFFQTIYIALISYYSFITPLTHRDYYTVMLNLMAIILVVFVEITRDDPDVAAFLNDPNFDRLINSLMARMRSHSHTGGKQTRNKRTQNKKTRNKKTRNKKTRNKKKRTLGRN